MTLNIESSKVLNISNFLSLLRVPLAFAFLQDNALIRVVTVVLAMLTDGLDGYLARKYCRVSQVGALLDPLTDKFFVVFVSLVLLSEGRLHPWHVVALMSRDFSVLVFGLYLVFSGRLGKVQFQSIWSGKATTLFQFAVLVALSMKASIPSSFFSLFIVLALLALAELFMIHVKKTCQ